MFRSVSLFVVCYCVAALLALTSASTVVSGLTIPSASSALSKNCTALPTLLYCTNVNWAVPTENLKYYESANLDSALTSLVLSSPGTRECRRWFRDLLCRYALPQCGLGGPCRSECEAFSTQCPGMAMPCQSFQSSPNCTNANQGAAFNSATYNTKTHLHTLAMVALTIIATFWLA